MNITRFVKKQLHHLHQLRDAPTAVAGGVSIGMFFGFSPFFGIKTLLAIAVAWLFRCSKLAAAIAVTLHDLLIPFSPIVLWLEYNLGYWVLSSPHHWPEKIKLHKLMAAESLNWAEFWIVGKPLIVGSLLVGTTAAFVSYFATHALLQHWNAKHHLRKPHADE